VDLMDNSKKYQKLKNEFCKQIKHENLTRIQPTFGNSLTDQEIVGIFRKLPKISKNTLIIINDNDRSTPSAKIIELLRSAGKIDDNVTFIIASGTHKPVSLEIAQKLSGATKLDTILVHDCDDQSKLIEFDQTSRGTPISVAKVLVEAASILTINSVEPHYFAGFTGGIKSIIPGIAGRITVESNHKWAITPDSQISKTSQNPLYEDLWEIATNVLDLSKIQTVQLVNHEDEIYHISIGPLKEAFNNAKQFAMKIYSQPIEKKVDSIISFVAEPLNKNLYQAQKAMENTKKVLKNGGNFILIASCTGGIGNEKFFKRMESLKTPEKVLETLTFETYKFGDHKAFYWAELAKNANLYYIGELTMAMVRKAFMTKIGEDNFSEIEQLNELLKFTNNLLSEGQHILVDEMGGFTTSFLSINPF
jgi:lactate racemase